jgi:ribosome assembly protein RRB1
MDWSPVSAGRLATGDCRSRLHLWEPQQGGKWAVGQTQCTGGHTGSVEDVQWSPTEETVLASCSVDKTVRRVLSSLFSLSHFSVFFN